MTPFQQDPARRIRRLSRHVAGYVARLKIWHDKHGKPKPFSYDNKDRLYGEEMAFVISLATQQRNEIAALEQTITTQQTTIDELKANLESMREVISVQHATIKLLKRQVSEGKP